MLVAAALLPACSSETPDTAIENEVSQISDEGPYGGHSVAWYKLHWNDKTREQRKWCWQQNEAADHIKSCLDAHTGWKLGRSDPGTNPPRRWEDGPSLHK